jgi:DeoR/GlpR family transcriptional regulator of sugar metabolism
VVGGPGAQPPLTTPKEIAVSRRTIEDREALVELHVRLHAEGKMSLRQIADLTGVNASTVLRDLRKWHDALLQSLLHNGPECNTPEPECNITEATR